MALVQICCAVDALTQKVPVEKISALVITHLTPRRVDSLKRILRLRAEHSPKLEVYLSNPGLQALSSILGMRLPQSR